MRIISKTDDRKVLVKRLSEELGVKSVYLGPPSFGYQIGDYFVEKAGSVQVEDDKADMELLSRLTTEGLLERADLNLPEKLEVSVPLEGHTARSLVNLVNAFCSREKLINKAIGCQHNFLINKDFQRSLADQEPETVEGFYDRLQGFGGAAANRGLIFEEETITVTFPFTSDHDESKAFIHLVMLINQQAKEQKRINKDAIKPENERYAFRCWLVRLGMNGKEYASSRKVLLKNLEGNCAFKTEEQGKEAAKKWKELRKEQKQCSEYKEI